MERTKKVNEITPEKENEEEFKWIKNGGGVFRTKNGKIIKPKEIFSAPLSDIPVAFRDTIVLLDDQDVPDFIKHPQKRKNKGPELPPVTPVSSYYEIVPAEEEGFFNVMDGNGKVINEQPLDEQAASDLVKVLTQ